MHPTKDHGQSLMLGAILMTITMVLHPTGGDNQHISNHAHVFIISHGIAIFSLPFVCLGFFGLTGVFVREINWSILAFIFSCLALISALLAAMLNGILLPSFVSAALERGLEDGEIQLIRLFIRKFNAVCDYVFMVSILVAIAIWSLLMLRTSSRNAKIVGCLGFVICFGFAAHAIAKFNYLSIYGFRIFVFGIVLWIICTAILLYKQTFTKQ